MKKRKEKREMSVRRDGESCLWKEEVVKGMKLSQKRKEIRV